MWLVPSLGKAIEGVNSIKPPLLVPNLPNTTTLCLRNKKQPHFQSFCGKH
jgi:hypothetical protein